MRGLFVLMKSGFVIFGIVVAAVMLWGCGSKSSPTGTGGGNTLSAPTLSSPSNGATSQATSPAFLWEAVTGATAYDVRVSTVATFASTVSSQTGLTARSASAAGLANSTTYYWEVNATNADTTSAWSGVWSFTTSSSANTAAPGVPVLVSPANGATGQSIAPALSWSSGSGGLVASYGVEVSTSASFGSFTVNQTGVIALGETLSGLANSTSYYWRVNATNANGTSAWTGAWSFTTIAAGTTGIGMVLITGGTFQMGSNNTALESLTGNDEEPVHSVTVSSFYMDTTDVTQASYQSLMGVNPSYFDSGVTASHRPVEEVDWYDAVLYCNARSKHDGYDTVYSYSSIYSNTYGIYDTLAGVIIDYAKHGYRLPTEAEWEYACRAGSTADYYWGQSYPPQTSADTAEISAHVWWWNNSPNSTQPVATKPANAFGLYDMSGNVWQWCNDWWAQGYASGNQTNPTGPASGSYRMQRGGSWVSLGDLLDGLCAAYRGLGYPGGGYGDGGFRCVRR